MADSSHTVPLSPPIHASVPEQQLTIGKHSDQMYLEVPGLYSEHDEQEFLAAVARMPFINEKQT